MRLRKSPHLHQDGTTLKYGYDADGRLNYADNETHQVLLNRGKGGAIKVIAPISCVLLVQLCVFESSSRIDNRDIHGRVRPRCRRYAGGCSLQRDRHPLQSPRPHRKHLPRPLRQGGYERGGRCKEDKEWTYRFDSEGFLTERISKSESMERYDWIRRKRIIEPLT